MGKAPSITELPLAFPKPSTLNPKPLNPKPYTLHPKPQTLLLRLFGEAGRTRGADKEGIAGGECLVPGGLIKKYTLNHIRDPTMIQGI